MTYINNDIKIDEVNIGAAATIAVTTIIFLITLYLQVVIWKDWNIL